MCEREIERERHKEIKHVNVEDVLKTTLDFFDIQIQIPSLDIQVKIHAQDPNDCIELAGRIISHLRAKNLEPKIEVLGIDY